ncbi:MAG: hypothetical protein SF066_15305 [Thermoanaerobaculia bacterium]|nr:hypothetical protein [Thermoanaerobaculia bacterium]
MVVPAAFAETGGELDLFSPEPPTFSPADSAAPAALCPCITGYSTLTPSNTSHTGFGSTCSAAQSNLQVQLWSAALTQCEWDVCSLQVIYKNTCYTPPGGGKAADGYALFGCYAYNGSCTLP